MSQQIEQILDRLSSLEKEVARLKSEKSVSDRALEFERLPDSATVGKDYAAYRFRCSEEAVMRGWHGTDVLKPLRISNRPLRWTKRSVDDAWREYSKTPKEKAADLLAKASSNANGQKPARRRSIITKQAQI